MPINKPLNNFLSKPLPCVDLWGYLGWFIDSSQKEVIRMFSGTSFGAGHGETMNPYG